MYKIIGSEALNYHMDHFRPSKDLDVWVSPCDKDLKKSREELANIKLMIEKGDFSELL